MDEDRDYYVASSDTGVTELDGPYTLEEAQARFEQCGPARPCMILRRIKGK